jgi:hypothetical protein
MPPLIARLLSELGCAIVDALTVIKCYPADVRDGWQLKPYALINSTFEEVIMLDADQVPLIDPATIFEWPEYRETGAVFWPDVVDLSPENPVWRRLGLEPRKARSFESGQICMNKKTHWKPLAVALRINELADTFYQLVYGDKDTFLLAWLLSVANFSLVPNAPMCDMRFLGQRDFAGKVIFQHRTNCKWSLQEEPYKSEVFVLQSQCEAILEELRQVWNGRDIALPSRSAAARAIERRLARQRSFRLQFGEKSAISISLLTGHQFGVGRSILLSNWCVRDGEDGQELVFYNIAYPSFVFPVAGDGPWIGRTTSSPPHEALLEPTGASEITIDPADEGQGLADEFIDVAMRGGNIDNIDHLLGALMLLARMEPSVSKRVLVRADEIEPKHSAMANALRRIAAQLPPAMLNVDARPNRSRSAILSDPQRYFRP